LFEPRGILTGSFGPLFAQADADEVRHGGDRRAEARIA
jgi:hypothetical protein